MGNVLRCFRPKKHRKYIEVDHSSFPVVEVRFAPLVLPDCEDFEYIDHVEIGHMQDTQSNTGESAERETSSDDVTPSAAILSDVISLSSQMDVDGRSTERTGSSTAVDRKDESECSQETVENIREQSTSTQQPANPSRQSMPVQRRFHDVSVNTIRFSIPEGYSPKLEYLGGGSYGNVVKTQVECRDGLTRIVAIKKLKDPFYDPLQARRIYREIKLLQLMKHDNIIRAMDLYTPETVEHNFKDVYVVTEFAGSSILKMLRSQQERGTVIITPNHVQFIVYQLLRAVKYIHSAKIMHRDLKPSNLALTEESDLTVLDFGLARSMERKDTGLTQYVMTRWYRSPEVIYWNIDSYNTQADIWSVGCIAAELMLGKPLFTGEDANAQYDMITRIVGSPDEELLRKIEQNNSPAMRMVIDSLEKHERVHFPSHFRNCDARFVDFLDQILVLDPERRLTVEDALRHEYMEPYYDPQDEPVADFTLDDDVERSVEGWKGIIWQEIQNFVGDDHSPKLISTDN